MASTRPTRTPAIRMSSPMRSPSTSVKVAEYESVSPVTERCSVDQIVYVNSTATTANRLNPASAFPDFMYSPPFIRCGVVHGHRTTGQYRSQEQVLRRGRPTADYRRRGIETAQIRIRLDGLIRRSGRRGGTRNTRQPRNTRQSGDTR